MHKAGIGYKIISKKLGEKVTVDKEHHLHSQAQRCKRYALGCFSAKAT